MGARPVGIAEGDILRGSAALSVGDYLSRQAYNVGYIALAGVVGLQ